MKRPICEHLEFLYGSSVAEMLTGRVLARLDAWRPRLPAVSHRRQALELTEHDALLITYADQVTEPGQTPLRVLAAFCIRHLKGTMTGVHILPFYPWSSDDGFSVKDFFEVEPGYGAWGDIEALGAEYALMFDAVFNHVSAQSGWYQGFLRGDPQYRDLFITVTGNPDLSRVIRPRALPLLTEFQTASGAQKVWTTFSADQVDLNFKNPEVLLLALEALLFYVSKGARLIRLDAIAFLWKEIGTSCLHLPQTHRVIQFLRAVLDEVAPSVLLVTETNVPHADNVSYFGDGTNEAQLVYNFALPPLVLHSFVAGNAQELTRWARTLTLPSDRVTFFNFLASHDGIGLNPVRGILGEPDIEALVSRTLDHGGFISYKNMPDGQRQPYEMNINFLDALSNPAGGEGDAVAARKLLTAHSVLFSLQGVPGVYFHSLLGSRGDPKGAEASGIPRRINREKLRRDTLAAELADQRSLRHLVLEGHREMLSLRRRHPAFSPGAEQQVLELDSQVFAVLRQTAGNQPDRVLCLHNFSSETLAVRLDGTALRKYRWSVLRGVHQESSSDQTQVLEPWSAAWLAGTPR